MRKSILNHGNYKKTTAPVAFILLPKRTKKIYEEMFKVARRVACDCRVKRIRKWSGITDKSLNIENKFKDHTTDGRIWTPLDVSPVPPSVSLQEAPSFLDHTSSREVSVFIISVNLNYRLKGCYTFFSLKIFFQCLIGPKRLSKINLGLES